MMIYRGGTPKKAKEKSTLADLRHGGWVARSVGCRALLEEGVPEKGVTHAHEQRKVGDTQGASVNRATSPQQERQERFVIFASGPKAPGMLHRSRSCENAQ